MPRNRQTRKTRRIIRNSTPQSRNRAINRPRSVGAAIRKIANLSPQAQGINAAERRLRAINQANKKKKKKR